MAERKASVLRRRLLSAERFRERAISAGSSRVNTPASRSSAALVSVTLCDHLAFLVACARFDFTEFKPLTVTWCLIARQAMCPAQSLQLFLKNRADTLVRPLHNIYNYFLCLKYWISRSCCCAAALVLKVPRFRRFPVLGSFFLE